MPVFLSRALLAFFLLLSFTGPSVSEAAIIGNLEAPDGFASQIGNVQGWVYTNTPGAELIQPFDVLVNGVKSMEVPCCSARGDVKGDDPDIPLQTGFSAVTNWAREAGGDPITVQVVVKDTAGGEKILTKTNVEVYALASFPFVTDLNWAEVSGPVSLGAEADRPSGILPSVASWCTLSNTGTFTPGGAELLCRNVDVRNSFTFEMCDQVRFSWDKASQGFKQTSDCEDLPRWTENGDGTATDNTTGLMWELKTDDGSPHDVTNEYAWTAGVVHTPAAILPTGALFTSFLATLNGATTEATCFAGHCDWRIPTIEELESLLQSVPGCDVGGVFCTTTPGEVSEEFYQSSTSCVPGGGNCKLIVSFDTGATIQRTKTGGDEPARAVRGCLGGCGDGFSG